LEENDRRGNFNTSISFNSLDNELVLNTIYTVGICLGNSNSLSSTVIKKLEQLECDILRSAALALKETVCSNVIVWSVRRKMRIHWIYSLEPRVWGNGGGYI
jgi:hypothetical protein